MSVHKTLRTIQLVLAGAIIGIAIISPATPLLGVDSSLTQELIGGALGGAGVFAAKIANLV